MGAVRPGNASVRIQHSVIARHDQPAVRKLDGAEPERVPNYSTALLPAMQVTNRFRHWRMEGRTDLGTVDAALINEPGQEHWVRSCATVPEAVCKAALVSLVEADVLIDKLLEE